MTNKDKRAKKIRKIEIKSNKLVDEAFSGEYRSGFRGRGMEFENIRLYSHGDDVRNIDWNVTARQDRAYVKQFREEREMNIFLLIDMSRSVSFGEKREFLAEIAATIAFSAIANNDRAGALFFTSETEKFIPSASGKSHVLSIVDEILNFEPKKTGTDITSALKFFNRTQKKRAVTFLISDFCADGYERELKATAAKHDLICIHVATKSEQHIPKGAIFTFEDSETGELFVCDTIKGGVNIGEQNFLPKRNVITVYTGEDYVKPLKHFFKKRGSK